MNGSSFDVPDPSVLFSESMERMTDFWKDVAGGVDPANATEMPNPDSMRKMRDKLLNHLAASYDEYLRSPAFADQLRQMLQQGVQAQQKVAEMLGQTQSAWQASSRQDVDSMMEVMQRLERRIGDGFARLDERVDALEASMAGSPPKTKPKAKKRAPAAKQAARKRAKKVAKKTGRKSAAKKAGARKSARSRK